MIALKRLRRGLTQIRESLDDERVVRLATIVIRSVGVDVSELHSEYANTREVSSNVDDAFSRFVRQNGGGK